MASRAMGDKIIQDEFGTSLYRPMIWCDKCNKYIRVWSNKTKRLENRYMIRDKQGHYLPMNFVHMIHITRSNHNG